MSNRVVAALLGLARHFLLLAFLLPLGISFARADTTTYSQLSKLIRAQRDVKTLGPDLFGDKVNLYTGSLEFVQTDVSVPGNNTVPVAVGRRLIAGQDPVDGTLFGNWDLEIPHLHGVFATSSGWKTAFSTTDSFARCTSFGPPPTTLGSYGSKSTWNAGEFWHGSLLYVPGNGDQEMLRRSTTYATAPDTAIPYPVVTRNNWVFRCLSTLANGAAGEGFVAISPEGTQYQFDWLVSRSLPLLTKTSSAPVAEVATVPSASSANSLGGTGIIVPDSIGGNGLAVSEVWILPTKVTDRFGNSVVYTYDATNKWQLKSITSVGGGEPPRTVTLSYVTPGSTSSNLVSSVSDGTRTWTYAYDSYRNLQTVTLPDSSQWQVGGLTPLLTNVSYWADGDCETPGALNTGSVVGSITHPSGAIGQFTLTPTRHSRALVDYQCVYDSINFTYYSTYPKIFDTNALTQKTISGPGLATLQWSMTYVDKGSSWASCTGDCHLTTEVDVTDPAGVTTRSTFGTQFRQTEGQLQQTDVIQGGAILRSTYTSYAEPVPPFGVSDQRRGDGEMAARVFETSKRQITQQGVDFVWEATVFDKFAHPVTVQRSSSLSPSMSRTENTTYDDNIPKWMLGQVQQVTEASTGAVPLFNTYNATTANLETVTKYGIPEQSMTYYTDGTVASRTDGAGNTTTFTNYMRGIPQNIAYPNGSSESAAVNGYGFITSSTDAYSNVTQYDPDPMGRLAKITYATGDPTNWTPTVVSFAQTQSTEYDLGAGHWRQDVATGNGKTSTYFDALWRPVYTFTADTADSANTSSIVKRAYDFAGRTTFTSYPQRNYGQIGGGVATAYDGLGRVTTTSSDSELGVLSTSNSYDPGFQTTHIDASGNRATRSFQAFDTPSEDSVTLVGAPENLTVTIDRDIFGKPLSVTRSGGGYSATRSYVYDLNQRLCKTIEPETGATLQNYDSANNISWRAPGLALTSSACDRTSVAPASKISFGYDPMNQLTSTTYGDGSQGITRSYTADGLPATVVSGGATWTMNYNHRRLPTTQILTFAGQAYSLEALYDVNGNTSQLNYPTTGNPIGVKSVDYAPDALGRPTKAGIFASGIHYQPSGAIAGFNYGNGKVHALTQNVRLLPWVASDTGVVQDAYGYDKNANVLSITDQLAGQTGTRNLSYDGLDRLKTANAPGMWGNASYSYDVLDNIRSSTIGTRNNTYTYPSKNLLDTINSTDSAFTYTYRYDPRGNIVSRGAQGYVFDLGNRMTSATGRDTYLYDGYGHRVQTNAANGSVTLNLYSPAGQLLYTQRSGGPDPAESKEYIYLHQHQIAEMSRGSSGADVVTYIHTDGLGSPVARTDAAGNLVSITRYEPYGGTAGGVTPTIGFTGHVNDADTGLVYMQQRYYDPVAGRFLSIDPVTTDANTGGSFNRYVYAANNSYKYIDPDGRMVQDPIKTEFFDQGERSRLRESPCGADVPICLSGGGGNDVPNGNLNLGEGFTARLDTVPGADIWEIHVYGKKGEVGLYNDTGWFNKHGKVGAPDGFPDSAANRLKGIGLDQMRRRGHLPEVGKANIKGDNWKSLSTAGKFRKMGKILGPLGVAFTVGVGVYEKQPGSEIATDVTCGVVWGCGDAN